MNRGESRRVRGFTLVELLVTIAIIGLLAAAVIPVMETFRNRAKKAKCLSHMRTLHVGFSTYIGEHGGWPQLPEDEYDLSEEQFFGFWIEALRPYGIGQENWLCPSDRIHERLTSKQKDDYLGSYVITRFDDQPRTPFRWSQPWAIERGNFHGKGAHILMPDGSIQDAHNPFHGR